MHTNNPSQPHGIYIPNYPPPPLPFAPSHDSSSNSRIDTFNERFKHFLATRKANIESAHDASREIANDKLKLCDVTDEVRQCYELIDQIKVESATLLSENNRLSEIEWNEKMKILREKRNRMEQLAGRYANPNVQEAIEIKLNRRQEKRSRIQKRKRETGQLRQLRIETKIEKHRLIDEWFQESARSIEKQRQRSEEDLRIEGILSDVRRKKSNAVKNINLMESLIELHRVRRIQKSLKDRCEHEIVEELATLKRQWQTAFASYEEEERNLRKCMKSNDLYDEWQQILFGACEGSQQTANTPMQNMEDLIRIRSAWDAFIVAPTNSCGSSIPIGWITPTENPLAEWKVHKIS